ncbi:MAG: branched-chain amino acid ABC transporter permease [Candidatus Bathyarchaeia archaeon]|nr:branched-chain amino acid ABC transporter permease [Candidatus Bathyarchaeota archaeon]
MITKLIESLIYGALLGGTYAVIGIGMSLILGVMDVMNIAHGEFVLLGSYLAYYLLTSFGIDPLVSIIILAPIFVSLGYLLQRFGLSRPLKYSIEMFVITTLGISTILENVYLLIWSPMQRALVTNYSLWSYRLGWMSMPFVFIFNFFISIVVLLSLREFLRRTYLGMAVRASSEDWKMAQLMGINTDNIRALAFGLAFLTAGIAGILVGLTYPFSPPTGKSYMVIAFGVVVLGGLGSMVGTFVGGIIIGLVQVLTATFFNPAWQLFASYLVIFILLALRPKGVLGR